MKAKELADQNKNLDGKKDDRIEYKCQWSANAEMTQLTKWGKGLERWKAELRFSIASFIIAKSQRYH